MPVEKDANFLTSRFDRALLWYYSELVKIFQMRGPSGFIIDEPGLCVTLLRQIVEADSEIS